MSIKRLSALFIFSLIFLAAMVHAVSYVYVYSERTIYDEKLISAIGEAVAQGFNVNEPLRNLTIYFPCYGLQDNIVNIKIARDSPNGTVIADKLAKPSNDKNAKWITVRLTEQINPGHYYLIIKSTIVFLFTFDIAYNTGAKDAYILSNGRWLGWNYHLTAVIFGEEVKEVNGTGGANWQDGGFQDAINFNYDAGVIGAMIFIFLVFAVVVPAYEFRIKEYGAGLLSMFFGIFVTLAIYCYLLFMPLWTVIFALLAGGVLLIAYKHRRGLTDSLRW